ncbi:hypothetical protein OUZ56_014956 [Daphnia magna]|uniref:Uncharacterized protein n=1 Tax=Daphnia magna TaxID=35525 RepID=A0ABR0ALE3_9CRUS|nr:hypothetical protein OUZ56_014956 [Daphnia magna]
MEGEDYDKDVIKADVGHREATKMEAVRGVGAWKRQRGVKVAQGQSLPGLLTRARDFLPPTCRHTELVMVPAKQKRKLSILVTSYRMNEFSSIN